jgi:hypothetical protein
VSRAEEVDVMLRNVLAGTLIAIGVCGAQPAAHHAEAAQFDAAKPVNVTGTIKKVEWSNPHIWFYVDVIDDAGKVTTWGFSGGPPGMLLRRGITREVLKIGTVVHVQGSRAKDGSNNASGGKVTLPDGRNLFTASAEDVGTRGGGEGR